ncbi:MAG: ribosome maturation factor RimP [Candidatus Actinomarina sp.]|jgi:ribosome maturation factor RimP|tara:strand:- start:26 stop:499 length:474 start_codon:yes stop_codon:yes gene_type:complete
MVSENEIQQQIDSYLKDENLELYDLNIVNFPNISKIEVFIYSVEDVNIDITTRLNRQLNRLVEDLGFEKGSFDMIVSSPGIERKLKSFRHFELSIGELIKVKLFDPINDVYTFEGDLVSVGEENIVLKTEITEIEISFSNIKNAKIEFKQFKERVKG